MATTTTKCEETLVDWLRDAHAMEKQAEQMLSNTAKRIEHYPKFNSSHFGGNDDPHCEW